MSFVTSAYEWFVNSLGWIWLFILLGAVAGELFWLYIVVIRASVDCEWDADRAVNRKNGNRRKHPVDLLKASRRRVSMPRYALPLFVGWAAGLVVFFSHLSWTTYLVIATLYLLSVPLQEIVLVHVARTIKKDRGETLETGFAEAVSKHFAAGFRLPDADDIEPWFEYRFTKLNVLQKYRYVFHIFRFWRILVEMFYAIVWPVTMGVQIFHDLDRVEAYDEKAPWWRVDRHASRV